MKRLLSTPSPRSRGEGRGEGRLARLGTAPLPALRATLSPQVEGRGDLLEVFL